MPLPQIPTVILIPGNLLVLAPGAFGHCIACDNQAQLDRQRHSQVQRFVLRGWPSQEPKRRVQQNWRRKELSVLNGCILWGATVVIPLVANVNL